MVKATKETEAREEHVSSIKRLWRNPKTHYGYLRLTGEEEYGQIDFRMSLFKKLVPGDHMFVEDNVAVGGRVILWDVRENKTEGKRVRSVHLRKGLEDFLLSIPEGSTFYAYSTMNLAAPDVRNLFDVLAFLHSRKIKTVFLNEDELDPDEYDIEGETQYPITSDSVEMKWFYRLARNETNSRGERTKAGLIRAVSSDPGKRPGRKRSVSEEQAKQIISYTNKGKTQKEVATLLNVSQPTISRYLLEAEMSDEQIAVVNKLRAMNRSEEEIAAAAGVTRAMITRYLKNPDSKGRAPVYQRPKPQKAETRRTRSKFQTPEELDKAITEKKKKQVAAKQAADEGVDKS